MEQEPTPQWDVVEREVILKLRISRAAQEYAASKNPEVHPLMKRDLYLPTMKALAALCLAIQEEQG